MTKKETQDSKKRRRFNVAFMAVVAFISILGFCLAGCLTYSPLIFDLGYILAIILATVGAARMSTYHLLILAISAAGLSLIVEITNTKGGLLSYVSTPQIYLFVVGGWIVIMVAILYLTGFLEMWLFRLGMLSRLQAWRTLPFLATLALFLAFMLWEGYLSLAGPAIKVMYAAMAALGLLVSTRRSAEWNLSLMVVSISIGGFMELVGSIAEFWHYHYGESLAVFFALSWAINSGAVHGLPSLFGVDISAHTD